MQLALAWQLSRVCSTGSSYTVSAASAAPAAAATSVAAAAAAAARVAAAGVLREHQRQHRTRQLHNCSTAVRAVCCYILTLRRGESFAEDENPTTAHFSYLLLNPPAGCCSRGLSGEVTLGVGPAVLSSKTLDVQIVSKSLNFINYLLACMQRTVH